MFSIKTEYGLEKVQEPSEFRPLPALEGRSLSKYFIAPDGTNNEVIRDFTFEIYPGEIVALIGPSGCGKSTLFNIISGMLNADTGALVSYGVRFDPRRSVGFLNYMFQEDRLLPWKSARQNIELALFPLKKTAKERRTIADRMLEIVGLSNVGNHFPAQLSGGMRSRIALARAFATSPKVLLMDEPFSKLDAMTREHIHEQLLCLRESLKFGCFFITHDVLEALALADRILIVSVQPMRILQQFDLKELGDELKSTLVPTIRAYLNEGPK